jgi:hypothetical protein
MEKIKQYDVVRVASIIGKGPQGLLGKRPPLIGDIACVVEIYTHPRGYELECVSSEGETEWLASFSAEDVTLEYVRSPL